MSTSLSDYAVARAKKVEANNAYLRELGLLSRAEELRSNALAWGQEAPPRDTQSEPKRKRPCPQQTSPSRKSRRLQGDAPELEHGLEGDECFGTTTTTHEEVGEESEKERQARIEECRRQRQIAAIKYAEIHGAAKAAKENPTATYEHTLKRCRTMSDKALLNRVKAIERATGKHCVVKMAIFKSCLQDEGMWEIAEQAAAALERLKSLQAAPER